MKPSLSVFVSCMQFHMAFQMLGSGGDGLFWSNADHDHSPGNYTHPSEIWGCLLALCDRQVRLKQMNLT